MLSNLVSRKPNETNSNSSRSIYNICLYTFQISEWGCSIENYLVLPFSFQCVMAIATQTLFHGNVLKNNAMQYNI